MHIVLDTGRMLLRRFTEKDAGALAELYGDPRVMRFVAPQPLSREEVVATVLPHYLREYQELAAGLGSFAAIEKGSGQLAGRFSLKPANSFGLTGETEPGETEPGETEPGETEPGGTELGDRLYPAFWGRGLATEGARALIDSGFGQLHLDRIVATTMADNTGSWRVLEKCGLRRTATFFYPGTDLMAGAEHGDYVYELTRTDWAAAGADLPSPPTGRSSGH